MTQHATKTEQTRKVVEDYYAAGLQGDVETVMKYMADDLVIYEPAYLPYGGEYRGKAKLAEVFQTVAQFMDMSKIKVHYIVAENDRTIAVCGAPDVNTGRPTLFAEESWVVDGKVAEIRVYYFDPQSMIEAPKIKPGN